MTGYPDGLLDARLELSLGGWTDVTDDAMPDGFQAASIRAGQPAQAQQPNPAQLNLAFDNDTGTFSPRYQGSPYYGLWKQNTPARLSVASPYGTYLRLNQSGSTAVNQQRAYADDSAALHLTGSLELRVALELADWRNCWIAQRQDSPGGIPSWAFFLNADGTVSFQWWDSGGTLFTATSSDPVPAAPAVITLAALLDADAGTVEFSAGASDGTADFADLTGLGSGGPGEMTSVRAGDSPLVIGWSTATANQLCGRVYEVKLYSVSGGAKTAAAFADFTSWTPGATDYTDAQGNSWHTAAGAEVTDRDYVLHAEASSIVPSALSVGGKKASVQLGGRLRRLQQGSQPAADSPMRRAVLSLSGDLAPVAYWPMEDGGKATSYGPAIGSTFLANATGTAIAASDTSFEASAALPQLNGAALSGNVPSYSGATAWTVRFLCKIGSDLPAAGDWANVCQVLLSSGTVRQVDVNVDSSGNLQLKAIDASASTVFDSGWWAYAASGAARWYSIEAVPVPGGRVQYNLIDLEPGAPTGSQLGSPPQVSESLGTVTTIEFNTLATTLTDTTLGHVTFQRAWNSLFDLGQPLNAWRGERAADRFARICDDNNISCRILGYPDLTQPMGPQPRGSEWVILRDCAWTEQGILFEPADAFGLGLRTRASMTGQAPAVTLSFDESNLPGSMQGADDDMGLLNDLTAQMPDGTQVRVVLDDGSPRSVSEPPVGAGRYTGQAPMPFNTADVDGLANVAAFYLSQVAVDEPKFRQVAAHFGIPGAPVADLARTRPGDLLVVEVPPASNVLLDGAGEPVLDGAGLPVLDGSAPAGEAAQAYQSGDIKQLVTGQTVTLGPGRAVTWDCVPASPWHPADISTGTAGAVLDTEGAEVLDTDGSPILDTEA